MAKLVRRVFTTGTTAFVPPAGVKHVFAQGIGGGGGGGKGKNGTSTGADENGGGGGGGSSTESIVPLTLTPGTSYDVVVGAGGNGGTLSNGFSGEDSYITPTGASFPIDAQLVCWPGAAGGLRPTATTQHGSGGIAVRDGATTGNTYAGFFAATGNGSHPHQGRGGWSGYWNATVPSQAGYQGQGASGGAGGADGAIVGSYLGGGGGGGGGGGPTGSAGGAGGAGGGGNDAGAGNNGSVGSAGSGFGAGGGGGGAGGNGSGGGGTGGNGGAGAPGRVIIFWWE